MKNLLFPFKYNGTEHQLEIIQVSGSTENPFVFGDEHAISIPNFYMAKTETTQALWNFIMDEDGSRFLYKGDEQPAEHVSWGDCQAFIGKINEKFKASFRLPSETEWEYAARGGQNWRDGFYFAGSNNMDESGWFEGNAGPYTDMTMISQLKNQAKLTVAHPVGQKKPNQLGFTAAILGDEESVAHFLDEDQNKADATAGPYGGTALTYLCLSKYLRLKKGLKRAF